SQKFPVRLLRELASKSLILLAIVSTKSVLSEENRKNSQFNGKNREFIAVMSSRLRRPDKMLLSSPRPARRAQKTGAGDGHQDDPHRRRQPDERQRPGGAVRVRRGGVSRRRSRLLEPRMLPLRAAGRACAGKRGIFRRPTGRRRGAGVGGDPHGRDRQ